MSAPLLDLNLASRPFRNNTLLWAAHLLALTALIAITSWNLTAHAEFRSELRTLEGTIGSIQGQMRELEQSESRANAALAKHNVEEVQNKVARANQAIQRKAFSWTRLFNELEEVLPYHVRMLSIRPEFVTGRRRGGRDQVPEGAIPVGVNGAAKKLEDLLEFEQNLLADPRFDDVDPHRWNRENNEVYFELRFLYFPTPLTVEPEDDDGADIEAEPAVQAGADPAEGDAASAPVEQTPDAPDDGSADAPTAEVPQGRGEESGTAVGEEQGS